MSLQKDFKWSDKVYTMKEFVDVFTYRLPQIIFIAVGWDGKDVEHTFSGDEMYRIAAVKRQRRVVTKHGSGYFVSIPATTTKKVDLFFPDGKVKKSVSMDALVSAPATVGDGTLKMMFENDEKVSFSFGPDQGAEISFGVMRVIDVYDERYLVGHSICDGKVYSPVMPVPIPVYMTIELAVTVGLVDGTEEGYYKVLADIEAQMRGGKTEIDDTDEIMLFPHDITGSDYEYIRPCIWVPGAMLSESGSQMELPEMTPSPGYSTLTTVRKVPHRRHLNKPLPPDPPASDTPTESRPHAVVAPVLRQEVAAVPQQSSVGETGAQPPLPERAPRNAPVTHRSSPHSSSTPPPATTYVNSPPKGTHDKGDPLYDELTKYQSGSAPVTTRSSEYKSIRDVPADIRPLTPEQLASCMRMLHIHERSIGAFREKNVDGYMLMNVDEKILVEEFKFGRFDAIKLMKFAKSNYRP